MKLNKYLPIGTVVLLKGQNKRFMITGFGVKSVEHDNKIFDYSGCLYPEGVATLKETIVFDHENIDEIFFIGYIDEEEKAFKEQLKDMIKKFEEQDGTDIAIPKLIEKSEKKSNSEIEVFNI